MYLLREEDIRAIYGGLDDNLPSRAALSILGGTVIGGGLGTMVAFSMAVPTVSLFPIWLAACTGAGGAIGSLVGVAYYLGNNACPSCKSISK